MTQIALTGLAKETADAAAEAMGETGQGERPARWAVEAAVEAAVGAATGQHSGSGSRRAKAKLKLKLKLKLSSSLLQWRASSWWLWP